MKFFIYMAALIIFIVGMTFYSLPFVAYYQIESAIIAKDAGKLASYTDFTALKRHLKAQKGQRVIKKLKQDDHEPALVDLSIIWAGLPSDQEIDKAISTEGFYMMLSGAGTDRGQPRPMKAQQELSPYQMIKSLIADSSFRYESISQFVVSTKDEKGRYIGYCSFVFLREGLQWRLANVILPVF